MDDIFWQEKELTIKDAKAAKSELLMVISNENVVIVSEKEIIEKAIEALEAIIARCRGLK
jgi:hypothetical protein